MLGYCVNAAWAPRHAMLRHAMRRAQLSHRLQTTRSRAPRANRKPVRAWSAQTRYLRNTTSAKRRFNRINAQRFENAAQ
eukprot:11185030-Lingulodinium_polyedra.AAC.1